LKFLKKNLFKIVCKVSLESSEWGIDHAL